MKGRRVLLVWAFLLLAACQAQLPWAQESPSGAWRIEGPEDLPQDEMKRAAWRELEAIRTSEYPRAEAYDAAYAMERYLQREGHPDAQVALDVEGKTMVFRVDPGELACVRTVRFRGVRVGDPSTFRPWFESEGEGLIPTRRLAYSQTTVSEALSRIEAWYRERGYIDAKAGPVDVVRVGPACRVDLVVPVEEGIRYVVHSVDVKGAGCCRLDEAKWIGKPFRPTVPPAMAAEITTGLANQGFVFAEVRTSTDIDPEKGTVDVHLTADPGTRRALRRVEIQGLRRTSRAFVRKQIPLREGRVLTRDQIDQSLQKVYRLGLWKRMDLDLRPVGDDAADVSLTLEEADSRRLGFGIGWGTWELLRGTVRYRDFNLTGHARYFEADATVSIRHQGLDLRIEDPWILGDQQILSFGIGGFRRRERYYAFHDIHAQLYYERLFGDGWTFRTGYRFEAKSAFDMDPFIPEDEQSDIQGFSRAAGPFVRLRWDRRDHLFLPTDGWLLQGSAYWSEPSLGASLSYLELEFRGSDFLSLRDGTVLGSQVQLSTREILDGSPTLPIQDRYFLGGGESARAYGQDQLTIVDRFGNGVGGLTRFMATVELRQRLVDLLHGAVFVDVGHLSGPSFSFRGVWGWGPGVGLRYYTPVGPVRFDLAYNPGNLYAATTRWQFHFGFGFTF